MLRKEISVINFYLPEKKHRIAEITKTDAELSVMLIKMKLKKFYKDLEI